METDINGKLNVYDNDDGRFNVPKCNWLQKCVLKEQFFVGEHN